MKHLLDVLERDIQGKMTEQDSEELKKKGQDWYKDIEKLKEKIRLLHSRT